MSTPAQVQQWLNAMPNRVTREVGKTMGAAGELLRTTIMANASGRPGPNAPTGDYRGSWQVVFRPGALVVNVSTNRPQALRLEFGYFGTDSLGRNYAQPAYAHVEPAILRQREPINQMIFRAVQKATT